MCSRRVGTWRVNSTHRDGNSIPECVLQQFWIYLSQLAFYSLLDGKQLIPGFQTDIRPFKRCEKLNLISCLTFKLENGLWHRFCSFVLPPLATISAEDLHKSEASQLSFCFSRRDCRKDRVSLLLAVEQAFSSGSSVETRN